MKSLFEKLSEIQQSRLEKLKSILQGLKYEDYIDKLNEMLEDPRLKALVDDAFGGELAETKLTMSSINLPISKLVPTQNEIDIDKSLKFGLKHPESIDMYFSKPAMIKIPIVTYNKQFVIDGHHRWSQMYCFNPDNRCVCINFNGDLSPMEMLKAVQGSIAADINRVPVEKVEGSNIFDMSKKDFEKYVGNNITDEIVNKIIEYKHNLNGREDVIEYLVGNIMKLKTDNEPIKSAPKRDFMPQTGMANHALDLLKKTTKIK